MHDNDNNDPHVTAFREDLKTVFGEGARDFSIETIWPGALYAHRGNPGFADICRSDAEGPERYGLTIYGSGDDFLMMKGSSLETVVYDVRNFVKYMQRFLSTEKETPTR